MSQAVIFKILKKAPASWIGLKKKVVGPNKISEAAFKKNMQKMNKHQDIYKGTDGKYYTN